MTFFYFFYIKNLNKLNDGENFQFLMHPKALSIAVINKTVNIRILPKT